MRFYCSSLIVAAMSSCAFAGNELSKWVPVGAGIDLGSYSGSQCVYALKTWDHDNNVNTPDLLAVGGKFKHGTTGGTSSFLLWNGTANTYTAAGSGFYQSLGEALEPGTIYAMTIDPQDNSLIVGGKFDYHNGSTLGAYANIRRLKWNSTDGFTWHDMVNPGYEVRALAAMVNDDSDPTDDVYAGLHDVGVGHSPLKRYDKDGTAGNSWTPFWQSLTGNSVQIGTGTGSVYALYAGLAPGASEEDLPVLALGGSFYLHNGAPPNMICQGAGYWSDDSVAGEDFGVMGAGVAKDVYAITRFSGDLAVGGGFVDSMKCTLTHDCSDMCTLTVKSTRTSNYLARRTSNNWGIFAENVPGQTTTNWGGVNGAVRALTVWQGNLVFGGGFSSAVGHSVASPTDNEQCYSGGTFHYTSGFNNVGYFRYDGGGSYHTLDNGLLGTVHALESYQNKLYAGGEFTITVGETTGHLIARWQVGPCSAADLGSQGGMPGSDSVLDNNDFIVFIDYFFLGDSRADLGSTGGVPGPDGVFNNNDFVVFIDLFFEGCN